MPKRIKISSKLFHHRVAKPFQFFHAKQDGDIPTGTPPLTGASNAGAVRKKRDSERISGFAAYRSIQCCQPYESRSVKNKAAANGGERRAHRGVRRPLFAQDDDEVFVTGSTLYAGDEWRSTPSDTTPLVITTFSAAVGHRRTEPGGYYC